MKIDVMGCCFTEKKSPAISIWTAFAVLKGSFEGRYNQKKIIVVLGVYGASIEIKFSLFQHRTTTRTGLSPIKRRQNDQWTVFGDTTALICNPMINMRK